MSVCLFKSRKTVYKIGYLWLSSTIFYKYCQALCYVFIVITSEVNHKYGEKLRLGTLSFLQKEIAFKFVSNIISIDLWSYIFRQSTATNYIKLGCDKKYFNVLGGTYVMCIGLYLNLKAINPESYLKRVSHAYDAKLLLQCKQSEKNAMWLQHTLPKY